MQTHVPGVIKEFRIEPHKDPNALSPSGLLRTHWRPQMLVDEELRLMAQLSWGRLVSREAVRWRSKVLVVMPMMLGDVVHVMRTTRHADRRDMGRAILAQLAQHLLYLHAADFMHGDLKLENALCGVDGAVVFGDYGAAHLRSGDRRYRGRLMSTYFAPEMATMRAYNKRADVWALAPASATCMRSTFAIRLRSAPSTKTIARCSHRLRRGGDASCAAAMCGSTASKMQQCGAPTFCRCAKRTLGSATSCCGACYIPIRAVVQTQPSSYVFVPDASTWGPSAERRC